MFEMATEWFNEAGRAFVRALGSNEDPAEHRRSLEQAAQEAAVGANQDSREAA